MRRAAIALAVLGFGGLMALVATVTVWWPGALRPEARTPQKQYTRLVAEGVRYRVLDQLGVDRLSFKSCRVEKRRSGGVSFGAFNLLVVDGLVLNLPAAPRAGGGTNAVAQTGASVQGLVEALLLSQGMGAVRFSGVRVNGLTINRAGSNGVERLVAAAQAESGMKASELRLRECAVSMSGGQETRVKEARLVLRPRPALVYVVSGGERRLEL